ncbi:WD domain containing protein [Cordyceps fumosorosea ARSEF 2679]|uniref:WD domain containing protein n=1 Tax=Cordyceps fumosorosea (strain ARSEF 2679) TaxID=1081104 RepID=A0A167UFV2_CORFA|nr:WD domain containing protein [Cordyceps fumosorosea ARSEF 2679]OAA61543.1 WD domain containing protein [Cordyceps fumosorosea ARSEF 2679]
MTTCAAAAVKLSRELAQVPITAVALLRDPATGALHALAGEDTDLVVYRIQDDDDACQREVARVRGVLSAQPIHGIRVHHNSVLLWGGPSVAVLNLTDLLLLPQPRVARLQAPDWIYDGAACPSDHALVALVTAHNEVLTARLCDGRLEVEGRLASPSRPMLYAAHVCWTSASEVLVAAGTVFGDVLVWKHTAVGGGSAPRMLYTLSGHEGSIFGVHVSPLMEVPGWGGVRLLASCSDDRTIRIWNVTESEGDAEEETSPAAATGVSDTGFRCAPAVVGGGEGRADVAPIATAMGHASRIWGVQFGLPSVPAMTAAQLQPWTSGRCVVSVYSFGEDATAQRWSVDVAAALREPRRLDHEKTYTLHDGKHLWSRAVVCDTAGGGVPTTHVLAGGADSKITLVGDVPAARDDGTQTWDVQDVMASMGRTSPAATTTTKQQRKELLGRYDFITPDVLLAVSNMGTVLLATFRGGQAATWEALTVDDEAAREDMRNVYAVRTVSHGGALLGSVTGGVYYFGLLDRRLTRIAGLAGRVVEITALSETSLEVEEGEEVEALVHLHRDAASVLLTLDRTTGAPRRQEAVAGLDARFVAMSAARIGDDLLAIGSRHGWIALLRRDPGGAFRPILDLPPASGDAVTAIVPLPPSPTSPATKYVLTTSRDGKYRIFQLDVAEAAARMTLVHETAPPFGPWIEGAWFTPGTGDLILYGFRSTDFVVWNETRREELAATNCGGAHRTFRLARGEQKDLRFAFTRTSRLAVHSQQQRGGATSVVVRPGHHGREVRSVAASPTGRYVATGAEDTTIRIWAANGAMMRPVAYMKRHVVGLQKVQWCRGDEYLFSAGGNEELFAWRVRTLDDGRVAVVCEGALADKRSAREDLRITDLDVSDDDGTLVTVALSDSAVRTYRYTPADGFALICEGRYTGACLTQARHLDVGGALQVVTAATDGYLALWRGDGGRYELVQTLRVHQNSVKSLDVVRLRAGGGGHGVVTGGDDNALAWTTLLRETEGGSGFRAELGAVVEGAHAAAITGIAMLEEEEEEVRFVSTSNDQWVKAWRVLPQAGEGSSRRMRLLGEAYSGVADAGDVAVLGNKEGGHDDDDSSRRVVVAGVGLEVWRLG